MKVLRRAETSAETRLKNIVECTHAVLFLGTPHRGSPGMASLGEVVRKVAGNILRVDSNASILRALGVDSPELELCRESFITQWRVYNFTVKTFQEATGVSGLNVGPANEKVSVLLANFLNIHTTCSLTSRLVYGLLTWVQAVPDTSSSLDDPREHAETIPSNHMNMCRFTSRNDPGYLKVGKELRDLTPDGKGILFFSKK